VAFAVADTVCRGYSAATGSTEANGQLAAIDELDAPRDLAKSVSSEPMPTLTPGLMRVPRWRMMMEPPVTSWPQAFTPSAVHWSRVRLWSCLHPSYVPLQNPL